jgi:hypothetical protein
MMKVVSRLRPIRWVPGVTTTRTVYNEFVHRPVQPSTTFFTHRLKRRHLCTLYRCLPEHLRTALDLKTSRRPTL